MKRKTILGVAISVIMILALTLVSACGPTSPIPTSPIPTSPIPTPSDTTPPEVSSTIPDSDATEVAINSTVSITFSEAMDPLTLTDATFTLKQGTTPVLGTGTYAGVTAIFTPDVDLTASTNYTATITTGVEDLAGNALADPYVWSFTTGATPDTTAPEVNSTTPDGDATEVSSTIGATPEWNRARLSARFYPGAIIGRAVPALYTTAPEVSSTIGATPDTTAPEVSSTIPDSDATDVDISSAITAVFSEAMNPLTVTDVTFTLKQGDTDVTGAVTYAGVTATFTPDVDLTANTNYTATITTGVEDLAGNALADPYVWSFTTGATPDTTAPEVSSISR